MECIKPLQGCIPENGDKRRHQQKDKHAKKPMEEIYQHTYECYGNKVVKYGCKGTATRINLKSGQKNKIKLGIN